jgi:cytosine/creatinine deaminase
MLTIPTTNAYVLANARVPKILIDSSGKSDAAFTVSVDGTVDCEIAIADGRITSIGVRGLALDAPRVDVRQGLVLPRFVDGHTHIDKGHIWARVTGGRVTGGRVRGHTPSPDGTHQGARDAVMADRSANWSADDVRRRMNFALRAAFAHGTGALRTHLDSIGPQAAISWPVFDEMRAEWKDRIALQAVALFPTELAVDDPAQFKALVAIVARTSGVIGGLTFMNEPLTPKMDKALDLTFEAAAANGLELDFHTDESASPDARSLERIALAAQRAKFKGRVIAGHCCSLALYDDAERTRVISAVRDAGIAIISLPMCNMYLQDRTVGRTPRWRGVTPLHELNAAGVPVMIASDNTRDPFYAYGDLDMLEVYREGTRILHFDHSPDTKSPEPWLRLIGPAPAEYLGFKGRGTIAVGGPADLVVLNARTTNEMLSRPQSDRTVLVNGRAIDRTLPDYRELDELA